jgi:hypothetical protein
MEDPDHPGEQIPAIITIVWKKVFLGFGYIYIPYIQVVPATLENQIGCFTAVRDDALEEAERLEDLDD